MGAGGVIPAAHGDVEVGEKRGPRRTAGLALEGEVLGRARTRPAVSGLCGLDLRDRLDRVWIEGFNKGDQDRIAHELVDDPDSFVKFGGIRWRRAARKTQQVITDMCWEVDLA